MRDLRAVPLQGEELSLRERLARGPLSLAFALQCATDVAGAIRQLHAEGRAHGEIQAGAILLREASALLVPPHGESVAAQYCDVAAFGSVLYQLVHGCEPPEGFTKSRPRPVFRRNDGAGLIASATDLAYRCMASCPETAPDMQKVLVEVRLLAVLSRQHPTQFAERPDLLPVAPEPEPESEVPQPPFVAEWVQPAEPSTVVDSPEPTGQRCPKCGSAYVYDSRPRTWLEDALFQLSVPFYRCHRCLHRYCILLGMKFTKESLLE